MSKRIGIYSGTFDPVHAGHIAFAEEAIRQCGLDKVFILVEPHPRRKQGVKAFEHRVEMIKLAIADKPSLGLIILEQQRFTVHETLPVLHARFKGAELQMLMGEDMLKHLASWPHIKELVEDIKIIIGIREGSEETIKHQISNLRKIRSLNPDYQMFRTELSAYSSSKIRLSLRRGKVPEGLHPKVAQYISEHGLYTPQDTSSEE